MAAAADRPRLIASPAPWIAAAAVGCAAAVLYLPVLVHAAGVWSLDQELSFGFVVPPAAAGLVWLRWRPLRASVTAGSALGLPLLVGGLLLFVAGLRSGVHAVAGVSFLPVVLGAAAYLYGVAAARILVAPVALVSAALSLYRGLLAPLGFALQEVTARGSVALASLAGVPVRGSGVDLFVGDVHFVVAQSCSGMDSLLALLCLGFIVVALAGAGWQRRALLLALVLPVVLVTNILRVTATLALSLPFGTAAAVGLPHESLSAAVFLLAGLVLWFACVCLRCQPRFDVTASSFS
jgi:exosortase